MTTKKMSDEDLERVAVMLEESAATFPAGTHGRDDQKTAAHYVRKLKINAKTIKLPQLSGSREIAKSLVAEANITEGDYVKIDFRDISSLAPSFMQEIIAQVTDRGGKII